MSSEEGAIINAKVPLVWMGVVQSLFGIFMLVNPLGFLSQYSINVSNINQADKMMTATLFQYWGIWNLLMAGFCSIACRVGSERTRMHINFANAVSFCINTLLILAGFGAFTHVGCSVAGLVFNLCLCALTAIVCGLGSGLSFKLPPFKKPMYWGSIVMAVICLFYSVACLLIPDKLMDSYQVPFGNDEVHELLLVCFQYGWSGVFFQLSAWLLAGIMHPDVMYVYVVNRYVAMIQFGVCLVAATNVAWWTTKNEDGELDAFITGQWFNFCMDFVFVLLTYVPVAMLDSEVAQSVKQAMGGQMEEGPTLLSPRSQQKRRADTYKAPLVRAADARSSDEWFEAAW